MGKREKARARRDFEKTLRRKGHLSEVEVIEYVGFEFDHGAQTIADQIGRYYLLVKNATPDKADSLLRELQNFDQENLSELKIRELCAILIRYVSGFTIHYEGDIYSEKGTLI